MPLNFDDPSIVYHINKGMILEASAGSGKTTILTERWLASFLYLVVWEQKSISEALRSITALTFTRKAATEMKIRIRARIDELWEEQELDNMLELISTYAGKYPDHLDQIKTHLFQQKENIDDLLSSAMITTINAYVLNILRAHPLELDSDIGLTPEEGNYDISATEKEAQLQVLRSLLQKEYPQQQQYFQLGVSLVGLNMWVPLLEQIRKLIFQYGENAIKQSLEESAYLLYAQDINKALETDDSIESIYQIIKPSIDALLQTLDKEIAFNGKLTNGNEKIYDNLRNIDSTQILILFSKDLLGQYKLPKPTKKEELNLLRDDSLCAYQGFIDQLYRIIIPFMLPISDLCSSVVKELQSRYGEISFGESEIVLLRTLQNSNILQKIHSQMRFFFADEYQDTSDLQKTIFDLIIADDRVVPFFVGDPKQSIYSFRKANVYVFFDTIEEFKNRSYEHKLLNTNYRSASNHVNLVNYLFSNIFEEDDSKIEYTNQLARKDGEGSFAYTLALGIEDQEKYNVKDHLDTAYHEALVIITKMLSKGIVPKDIMVLFRNKASILDFYRMAKEYYPQIPLSSSVRNILWDNGYITPLLSFLRVLVNPHHNLTMIELLKTSLFYKKDGDINLLLLVAKEKECSLWDVLEGEEYDIIREFLVLRDRIPLEELLSLLIKETHYEDFLYSISDSGEALATLSLFVDEAQKLQEKRDMSLGDFINYIDQRKVNTEEAEFAGEDALRLMTVHSAKGLEAPHVIYIHKYKSKEERAKYPLYQDHKIGFDLLGKGIISNALGDCYLKEYTAEEKRLAYVAITRAKDSFTFCALPSMMKNEENVFETQWASFLNKELIEANEEYASKKITITDPLEKNNVISTTEIDHSYQERYDLLIQKDEALLRQELPQFLSVSLLLDAEFNKEQFHDKYIKHSFNLVDSLRELGEEEFTIYSPSPMDIGNLVHILLQQFEFPKREEVEKYLHIHHKDKEEVFDLVLSYAYGYWESDFYQQLSKDTILQDKERQVVCLLPNDIMIRATADLYVSSQDQKHTIVDYKLSIGKNKQRYHRQLSYYALLSEKSGYKVDELVLFDLKAGREYTLLWDREETEKIFDESVSLAMNYLTSSSLSPVVSKPVINWQERENLFS